MQIFKSLVLACAASLVYAHGFLRSPRARGGTSAGPSNAICGRGGTRAGSSVATFTQGGTIDVEWDITIRHNNGFVEVRICDGTLVSSSCLNENLMQLANGRGTRVNNVNVNSGESQPKRFSETYRLPAGLSCPGGCVLQWEWLAPGNQNYHGCSDITINPIGNNNNVNNDSQDEEDEMEEERSNPLELRCRDRVSERTCDRRDRELSFKKRCCRNSGRCPGYENSKCTSNFCCERYALNRFR
ncbi:hypothetical protein SARC_09544 [Sphaeroforma arctica JP610]|uniref:Chitin-binding type-4 domain-containing protein n=1 Tax=Sphaeroforma arctica JP610 TaxID=667725 RepID=A0A0L0FNF6_9EUKA|nr:hypothetical protein SARC_09544 [Sphaeroforma arctica JP610]KNC78011.1 hypothetical protein SARC_09544 [Sphaeroforma arctica JP610]|eukprot:XP_014151913.1 hypothetical protein SARC_09544 [Sphaeroforma arctica JP610]